MAWKTSNTTTAWWNQSFSAKMFLVVFRYQCTVTACARVNRIFWSQHTENTWIFHQNQHPKSECTQPIKCKYCISQWILKIFWNFFLQETYVKTRSVQNFMQNVLLVAPESQIHWKTRRSFFENFLNFPNYFFAEWGRFYVQDCMPTTFYLLALWTLWYQLTFIAVSTFFSLLMASSIGLPKSRKKWFLFWLRQQDTNWIVPAGL